MSITYGFVHARHVHTQGHTFVLTCTCVFIYILYMRAQAHTGYCVDTVDTTGVEHSGSEHSFSNLLPRSRTQGSCMDTQCDSGTLSDGQCVGKERQVKLYGDWTHITLCSMSVYLNDLHPVNIF